MINPSELVDNLVALLRDIPELVAEMDGDPGRIYPYHDSFPKSVSLTRAIHQMPAPPIMAVWQGTTPGGMGGYDVWKHQVTLFMRAGATSYCQLFRLVTKGVPTAAGVPMSNVTVHESCYPMDLPLIHRQPDSEGLDYFETPIAFTEIGDD
jgi:hypothetical protein